MVLPEVSLIIFNLGISKEIKWKVKVVLLEVSLMTFILRISKGDQVEGESGVTRSSIDELYFSYRKEIKWKVEVMLVET